MASKISQIIFDKTGTLTIGRPLVVGYWENKESEKNVMLKLAASIEQDSRHPLAQAIIQEAHKKEIKLEKVSTSTTYAGKGLAGKIKSQKKILCLNWRQVLNKIVGIH